MTVERAIEILDPEHREHYESIEPVYEACRMGMEALKKVKALENRLTKAIELPVPIGSIVADKRDGKDPVSFDSDLFIVIGYTYRKVYETDERPRLMAVVKRVDQSQTLYAPSWNWDCQYFPEAWDIVPQEEAQEQNAKD